MTPLHIIQRIGCRHKTLMVSFPELCNLCIKLYIQFLRMTSKLRMFMPANIPLAMQCRLKLNKCLKALLYRQLSLCYTASQTMAYGQGGVEAFYGDEYHACIDQHPNTGSSFSNPFFGFAYRGFFAGTIIRAVLNRRDGPIVLQQSSEFHRSTKERDVQMCVGTWILLPTNWVNKDFESCIRN